MSLRYGADSESYHMSSLEYSCINRIELFYSTTSHWSVMSENYWGAFTLLHNKLIYSLNFNSLYSNNPRQTIPMAGNILRQNCVHCVRMRACENAICVLFTLVTNLSEKPSATPFRIVIWLCPFVHIQTGTHLLELVWVVVWPTILQLMQPELDKEEKN